MTDHRDDDEAVAPAPSPPMLVVAEAGMADAVDREDLDQMVRTARAGVARLALQLRAAEHAAAAESGAPDADLTQVSEIPRTDLAVPRAEPPRAMVEELAQIRSDALQLLARARAQAAGQAADASDETLALLRGPSPTSSTAPPTLRVVIDPPTPVAVSAPAPVVAPAPPAPPPVAAVVAPSPLPFSPPPPPEAEPVTEPVPVTYPAPDQPLPPAAADPLGELGALGGLVVVLAMPAAETARTAAVPVVPAQAERPAKDGASKFLYADVVLPMIAVLVLVVLLLAWVG